MDMLRYALEVKRIRGGVQGPSSAARRQAAMSARAGGGRFRQPRIKNSWLRPKGRVRAGQSKRLRQAFQAMERRQRIDFDGHHGTNQVFHRVDPSRRATSTDIGAARRGFWMTSSESHAGTYADLAARRNGGRQTILRTRTRFKRPKVIDGGGRPIYDAVGNRAFSAALDDARRRGHAGVIFRNVRDGPGRIEDVEPADVAVTFDHNNTRILGNRGRGRGRGRG